MDGRSTRARSTWAVGVIASLVGSVLLPAPAGAIGASAMSTPILATPVLALTANPTANGTWSVAVDGTVSRAGSAGGYGHAHTERNGALVTSIVGTPTGRGYWIASHNGGVFTHGDARFFGSAANIGRRGTVIDIESTPSGRGYWLFTDRGQVLQFGDAKHHGAPSSLGRGPIVDAARTPSGRGYWLLSSRGAVYAFGDAAWHGTAWGVTQADAAGIAPTSNGYFIVNTKGRVWAFGNAKRTTDLTDRCPGDPVTGIATSPAVSGYWLVVASGRSFAFSASSQPAGCGPSGTSKTARAAADLFDRVNAERQARGLAPLRWDDALAGASRSWSAEMARSGFRHSDLGRLLSGGRFNLVGENIAWARGSGVTAASLHIGWMESAGHRANLLSPNYQVIGIGVYCAADGTMYATQNFARLATTGSAPAVGTPPLNPITRSDRGSAAC
jgi:uncharacterized protein YkwD/predicted RNA-binding protein YlxR (DUF448 family)